MFLKRFQKPKPSTDADYVSAYKATGSLELLGELYERYMEMVYAICFRYLRDEEESKDAVMVLFEQLIKDVEQHEIRNFKSWLYATTRNYCLMQIRQRKLLVNGYDFSSEETDELPFASLSDTDAPDLEQTLTRMDDCLQALPAEQQKSVALFYLDQKSYADIASQTGYDLKQVKSYLQNGRRNLKRCMEGRNE
ncbi:RNA polymerase sigma factor [Tellurirhabdus bombi]|uniref:RNA polymerase sigma factor n=1 Tax=Tellurirhabdus bombi TaxID=2907205 RepID=UPI001F3F5974|nr:sigma-70 family RNA polymerase sigma factor [Tellurirhabdus bombi]